MAQPVKPFELPLEGSRLKPEVLDEIIRRVVEVAQPDRIILFGSAARGDMTHDSDVDLLVIKSGLQHRGSLEEQIYLSLFGLTVPVEVVVVTPEEVEKYRDKIGPIIGPALKEGVEVYALQPS